MATTNKNITLKTLNKSNVWDIQENDVLRLLLSADKDSELKDNLPHYLDIIRTAFELEDVKIDRPEIIKKYEQRGFKIGVVRREDDKKIKMGVKKRPINRVTDLTYENIHHISAAKLIDVLDRNFGGGWDSLSQSIRDIIETGFDVSTTTLPKDRLKKAGGIYQKKVADGFEVLEIAKGTWVEAIFVKVKPLSEKPKYKVESEKSALLEDPEDDTVDPMENTTEEDDSFNEEEFAEESYRTTFEVNEEDLSLEDAEVSEDDY